MTFMYKYLLIFLSNLLVQFACSGQITFSKLYYNCFPCTTWGRSVEQADGYSYVFAGGGNLIGEEQYGSQSMMKFDSLGNLITMKNFSHEFTDWYVCNPGSLKNIPHGRFIAGSTYEDSLNYGILYYLSSDCDTLWTKKIIGDGYTAFWNTAYKNDTIYLVGATRDTILYYSYMYLVAVDTLGNTIWERKYGTGEIDELGLTVDQFENGNFVVGGGLENVAGGLYTDGKFYKADKTGEAYFSKKYSTTGDDGPAKVKVGHGNDYLIMANQIDTTINEGDYQYVWIISRLDTAGNYIWRRFFNRPEFLEIWQHRENMDGSIIVCGTAVVDSLGEFHGYIAKLDADGNLLWERDYTTDAEYDAYFFDVQQTWDKGYIVSGSAVGDIDGEPNQQMWLVKLDSMGCLVPGCDEVPIINPPKRDALFSIYPNPVTNTSTVEIHIPSTFNVIHGAELELNIYDVNGRLVDRYANITVNNPGETIRFSMYKNNLSKGIYQANLLYAGNNLGVVKIVVQ